MAHDQAKISQVKLLLSQGVSIRETAKQANVSIGFVKKVKAKPKSSPSKHKKKKPKNDTSKKDTAQGPNPDSDSHSLKSDTVSKNDTPRDKNDPVDPDDIIHKHKRTIRTVMDDIELLYQKRNFNGLKCAKIALEALILGGKEERQLVKEEAENTGTGEVVLRQQLYIPGIGAIEFDELPPEIYAFFESKLLNQEPHHYDSNPAAD